MTRSKFQHKYTAHKKYSYICKCILYRDDQCTSGSASIMAYATWIQIPARYVCIPNFSPGRSRHLARLGIILAVCVRFMNISGVNCDALKSFELDLILRALDLTMNHTLNQRIPVDRHMLTEIFKVCDTLSDIGCVLKAAFLFGLFGLLRQSNLATMSASSFEPRRRHTCRGNVYGGQTGQNLEIRP